MVCESCVMTELMLSECLSWNKQIFVGTELVSYYYNCQYWELSWHVKKIIVFPTHNIISSSQDQWHWSITCDDSNDTWVGIIVIKRVIISSNCVISVISVCLHYIIQYQLIIHESWFQFCLIVFISRQVYQDRGEKS